MHADRPDQHRGAPGSLRRTRHRHARHHGAGYCAHRHRAPRHRGPDHRPVSTHRLAVRAIVHDRPPGCDPLREPDGHRWRPRRQLRNGRLGVRRPEQPRVPVADHRLRDTERRPRGVGGRRGRDRRRNGRHAAGRPHRDRPRLSAQCGGQDRLRRGCSPATRTAGQRRRGAAFGAEPRSEQLWHRRPLPHRGRFDRRRRNRPVHALAAGERPVHPVAGHPRARRLPAAGERQRHSRLRWARTARRRPIPASGHDPAGRCRQRPRDARPRRAIAGAGHDDVPHHGRPRARGRAAGPAQGVRRADAAGQRLASEVARGGRSARRPARGRRAGPQPAAGSARGPGGRVVRRDRS